MSLNIYCLKLFTTVTSNSLKPSYYCFSLYDAVLETYLLLLFVFSFFLSFFLYYLLCRFTCYSDGWRRLQVQRII